MQVTKLKNILLTEVVVFSVSHLEAYIKYIRAIDLNLADSNPFIEHDAREDITMSNVYKHQWGVHKVKKKTCEVYDDLMSAMPYRRGLRAGKIATLIGKRSQTIAQYKTDVESTAHRTISPGDLLKMILARDEHIAHRFFGAQWLRETVLTGPTEALPEEKYRRFCATHRIFEVRDQDGELVTSLMHPAHAQQIADRHFGKVTEMLHLDRELPMSKEAFSRSRFRRLLLSGRVSVEDACVAFDRCQYSLLAYWTEHIDKEVPDDRILAWLEAKAHERKTA